MTDNLSVEVEKFGIDFESGERTELEARDYLWQELPPKIAALEQRVEQLETEGCGQCEACEDFFPLSLLKITDDGVALCPDDWDEILVATVELEEEA